MKIKYAVAGILIALIAFFAVFAYFDWVIGTWVNAPYVDSPERSNWNQAYWTSLAVSMLMVGVFGAIIAKLALPKKPLGTKLAAAILFSTIIMMIGNLEDWLYYIIGQHSIPPLDSQMNWLFQSGTVSYWLGWSGSWTVLNTLVWSIIWLFIILPIGLTLIFRKPK